MFEIAPNFPFSKVYNKHSKYHKMCPYFFSQVVQGGGKANIDVRRRSMNYCWIQTWL